MSAPPSKNIVISTASFNDLPEETAAEILLKLGVKDLIRSTSVSKTWYSLINNPSFISSQIRNAVSTCHDNAILIIPPITSHQNYCSLISTDTSSLIQKFDIPFVTKTRSLQLISQIHGMLLLTDLNIKHSFRELYLWNPYVNRHRVLVSTCFKKLLDNRDRCFSSVGMGFDKLLNDYKILRIVYVKDDKKKLLGEVAPKVEIFSLKKNTWRKIKNPEIPMVVYEDGTYVHGCYYWLERVQPGSEARTCYGNNLRVMYFDFHNELFGEFKVPDDVPRNFGDHLPCKLMKFQESLALCVLDAPIRDEGHISFPYSMWSMREENGVVTWTSRFRAALEDCGQPLGITKNGTLIIEAFRSEDLEVTSIVSCNIKSMVYKDHGFGKHGGPEVSRYVISPSTVDASFPESLIMYEGGKSLSKYT